MYPLKNRVPISPANLSVGSPRGGAMASGGLNQERFCHVGFAAGFRDLGFRYIAVGFL